MDWFRAKTRERQKNLVKAVDRLAAQIIERDPKQKEFLDIALGKDRKELRKENPIDNDMDGYQDYDDERTYRMQYGVADKELAEDEEEVVKKSLGVVVVKKKKQRMGTKGYEDEEDELQRQFDLTEVRDVYRQSVVVAKYEYNGRRERMAPSWNPDRMHALDFGKMKRQKQFVVTQACKDGEEGTFIEKMSMIEGKWVRELIPVEDRSGGDVDRKMQAEEGVEGGNGFDKVSRKRANGWEGGNSNKRQKKAYT